MGAIVVAIMIENGMWPLTSLAVRMKHHDPKPSGKER